MSGKFSKLKKLLHKKPLKIVSTIILSAAAVSGISIFFLWILPYSDLNDFEKRQNSTRFYDYKNQLIYILPLEEGLRREYYSLDEIPESIQEVFIHAEDKNFWNHNGVDFSSILRAVKQNSQENRTVSGASTITMQLARLITPRTGQAGLGTKIRELIDSFRLELKLSKKQILEYYLNSIPFGNQIEGLGSAARLIYGCEINQLSQAQVLCLAVTPRRPAYYSPLVNPENSYEQAMLIGKSLNFSVTKEEWVNLTSPVPFSQNQNAPHYINWISSDFKNKGKKIPDRMNLSLDLELNNLIEGKIQEQLELFRDSRITNGAALVFDNRTGAIVAWVGNSDFFSEHSGQVDGVISRHQSGSSTKPFLYALALENGYVPNQILEDIPKDFGGQNVYVPLNFNNRYNGPQSMRVCLASSLNIPAVDILYHLGIDRYMNFLESCGFDSLKGTRASTGLSLALGSNEVTLLELTRAFSIFPNDGILKEVVPQASDYNPGHSRRVLNCDTARVISDFLSDRNAQTLGFGNAKVFKTSYPAIFKTGTANQFQDIVSLCATPDYTCGVWMGNLNGETVIKKTGSSIPAYVCRTIQDYLFEKNSKKGAPQKFKVPDSYKKLPVCALSGMKSGPDCPSTKMEYVEWKTDKAEENFKTCTWHYRQNGITRIRYPSAFQHWASGQNINGRLNTIQSSAPLEIMYPTDNAVFFLDATVPESAQQITVLCSGGSDSETTAYLDGNFLGVSTMRQSFKVKLTKGKHSFTIINGNETKSIHFEVR